MRKPSHSPAFTLVELIATIAILAALVAVSMAFIGNYVSQARQVSDQQSLEVLNDAINRYKMGGGSLAALTAGKPLDTLLTTLQTPVIWNGVSHQFLSDNYYVRTGSTIAALGSGAAYRLTQFGSYTSEAGGDEIPASALPTYLINEDCDDTGTPSGWVNATTVDWDDATEYVSPPESVVVGSSASTSSITYTLSSETPTLAANFWVMSSTEPTALKNVIRFLDSSDNELFRLVLYQTTYRLYRPGLTTYLSAAATHLLGRWESVWVYYAKGTGANGTARVYLSTNGVKPASPTLEYTDTTATANVAKIVLGETTFIYMNFDDIKAAETELP